MAVAVSYQPGKVEAPERRLGRDSGSRASAV